MSLIRVLFLGTPDFAKRALEALLQDEHYEVVGVVTQPDRPRDRSQKMKPSVVAEFASSRNLAVFKPEKLKSPEVLAELKALKAEIAVVVAYGQIVPQAFLDAFPLGAVNLHGSLLPRWRGAAPIQRALEAGDPETGIALQKMVFELDAGDIIGVRKLKLDQEMDALAVYDQLAVLGAELLHIEMMDYIRGALAPIPQEKQGVTYAKKILKEEAKINWSSPAHQVHNKVRAFIAGPQAYCFFKGTRIKVLKTKPTNQSCLSEKPGQLSIEEKCVKVATQNEWLQLVEIQPESKKRLKAYDYFKSLNLDKVDLILE